MKTHRAGFTLIEMLTVIAIIAIIASLIVGVAGFAQKKAAAQRTAGEIKSIETACESYKTDNGSYPREQAITEAPSSGGDAPIDPRKHGNPSAKGYLDSSKYLYQQLTGDGNLDGNGGDDGAHVYGEFSKKMLLMNSNSTLVTALRDPYGLSYGYSTAGAAQEDAYRQKARTSTNVGDSGVARDQNAQGFNSTFDLWSTANQTTDPPTDAVRSKWIKNWQ